MAYLIILNIWVQWLFGLQAAQPPPHNKANLHVEQSENELMSLKVHSFFLFSSHSISPELKSPITYSFFPTTIPAGVDFV